MKITPLLDRILLKRDEAPGFFDSGAMLGLAIPDSQRENFRPFTGTIADAGPGKHVNGHFCPVDKRLTPGTRVRFAPAGFTAVEHEGVEHLLVNEADIFAILDEVKRYE